MNHVRRHVLLVGRHYWPHGSHDSAGHLQQLAQGWARRGVGVDVLVPQYGATVAERFQVSGVTVHRSGSVPRRDWVSGRYIRHLSSWITQNAHRFDVVFADAMREEANAAINAARQCGLPCVVRDSGFGHESDLAWSLSSRAARKHWTMATAADQIVTPTASKQRALIAAGVEAQRVTRIAPGYWRSSRPTRASKLAARRALAEANADLQADARAVVVLCVGRMEHDSAMRRMVSSAAWFHRRYPEARMWLIGDGPARDAIHQDLRAHGVRAFVAIPGSFADSTDLFAAADVYLQLDDQGLDHFLPTVNAAELPVVAADIDAVREVLQIVPPPNQDPVGGDEWGIAWFDPSANDRALRLAIRQIMDHLADANANARSRLTAMIRRRSHDALLGEYLDLFDRVKEASSTANSGRYPMKVAESGGG